MAAPKASVQRRAVFGKGGTTRMFRPQAAGPATAGRTGKTQNVAPGAKRPVGGPRISGHSLSLPAAANRAAQEGAERRGRFGAAGEAGAARQLKMGAKNGELADPEGRSGLRA